MSALNDTLTEREVQHEFNLHSPLWETEHMQDDDVQKLRAETSRMRTGPRTLDEAMRQHYYAQWYDDCDQEEER